MTPAAAARMHPLTLRFAAGLEREFQDDAFPRALPQIRAAFLIGGVLILLAGASIGIAGVPNARLLGGVVVAVALTDLLVAALSYAPAFRRWKRPILAVPGVAWAVGAAALIWMLPTAQVVVSLLMGTIIVMIYAFVFTRMGFVDANYVAWVMLAGTLTAAVTAGGELAADAPLFAFHTFNGYLSAALAGYFFERYIRRDFLLRRALEAERAESERLRIDLEKELAVGRQIQAGFLPAALPAPRGYEIHAEFRPARQVAGDFYDAFPLPGGRRVALVVGDVCGKGVGAALFMALFRTLLRVVIRDRAADDDASAVASAISAVNDYIATNHERANMFATVFAAILDTETGDLTYVNAGHDPPALAGAAPICRLEPTGPAVGLMEGMGFGIGWVRLDPGDVLVAFTDGVTDARGADGLNFGEDRLLALLDRADGSAAAAVTLVQADLDAHTRGAEPFDDVTLLAVGRPIIADAQSAQRTLSAALG